MISQIFKTGGGAGIGSYVLVMKNGELLNPKAEKIRWAYDSGENLYLSIIDDSTEEALLPLTGYVDNDGILHLFGRDFDDNKTYQIEINGQSHEMETEIVDGIVLGDGTLSGVPEYDLEGGEAPSQDVLADIFKNEPTMFKMHIIGEDPGSYDPGSYEPGSYDTLLSEDLAFSLTKIENRQFKYNGETKNYKVLYYTSMSVDGGMHEDGSYDLDNSLYGLALVIGQVEGSEKCFFNVTALDMSGGGGGGEQEIRDIVYQMWYSTFKPYIDAEVYPCAKIYKPEVTYFDIEESKIEMSYSSIEHITRMRPDVLEISVDGMTSIFVTKLFNTDSGLSYSLEQVESHGITAINIDFENYVVSMNCVEFTGGNDNYASNEDIDDLFAVYYSVNYELGTGITLDEYPSSVKENLRFERMVYIDYPRYNITEVRVILGGVDITTEYLEDEGRYVWNGSSVLIPEVNGDIDITIVTEYNPDIITVSSILTDCYVSSGSIPSGYTSKGINISAQITASSMFTGLSVLVFVGGQDVTAQVWDDVNQTLYIENVQDDVNIEAYGTGYTPLTYSIEYNLSNCSSSNKNIVVEQWTNYSTTIMADKSYSMKTCHLTIDGDNYDKYISYDSGVYYIDIPSVPGNVVITAVAESE